MSCSPQSHKQSDTTEQLNWTELISIPGNLVGGSGRGLRALPSHPQGSPSSEIQFWSLGNTECSLVLLPGGSMSLSVSNDRNSSSNSFS